MKFESRRERRNPAGLLARWLSLVALTVLAACGGGDRVGEFVPERIIAFGDEASVITSAGSKHTINALDAVGAPDCNANPIWVQYLAQVFGLPFAQCNPTNAPVRSLNYAERGAKAADVVTQIDQHLATGSFGGKDLVTVYAGVNDVIEQYGLFSTPSNEAAITAVLGARGAALADQVNRIASAGGKVLIVTVTDLSLTPFAIAEQAARPGENRAALIKRLVDAFNVGLRLRIENTGRKIGIVIADELLQSILRNPGAYGFSNVTTAACTSATVLQCTTQTLVTGATSTNWLWADSLQFSPGGHRQIAAQAETRARNNPF